MQSGQGWHTIIHEASQKQHLCAYICVCALTCVLSYVRSHLWPPAFSINGTEQRAQHLMSEPNPLPLVAT